MTELEFQEQCKAIDTIKHLAIDNDLTVIIYTNKELDGVPSLRRFEDALIEHGSEIISMYQNKEKES